MSKINSNFIPQSGRALMGYSLTPFPAFSDDPPHSLPRFLHSLPFMTSLLFPAHTVLSHTSTLFLCDPSIWSSKPGPTSNTTTKPVLLCLKTLLKHLFSFRGFRNVLYSILCHHSLFSVLFPSACPTPWRLYLWRFTFLPCMFIAFHV